MYKLILIMAYLILNSDITIGSWDGSHSDFRFGGVNEVRVKRSMHSYADEATIKVPSIARYIPLNGSNPVTVVTGKQFKDGDPITINLGYSGRMNTVFKGFVKRRNLNMPLEIECEGYVRPLRLGMSVTAHYKQCMASDLLNLLTNAWITGTGKLLPGADLGLNTKGPANGIKVVVANDIPLLNVSLRENNGVEIIEAVKRFSQGALNIFFVNPTTLWCGLTYTPYSAGGTGDPFGLGTVNYRLGYNVVKDNGLKERDVSGERVQILFGGTLATGEKVRSASDDKTAARKQKSIFNNMGDLKTMKMLANELQYMGNYAGYEGSINGFLEPYCGPGWIANIADDRYPERNGKYMIEGTDITYGQKGARIKVEIGPLLGFNPNA